MHMAVLISSLFFSRKFQGPVTDVVRELREELVPGNYEQVFRQIGVVNFPLCLKSGRGFFHLVQVDWKAARHFVHPDDLYTPHTVLLESFFKIVNLYEFVAPSWLRKRALDWIYRVLEKEDEFTNYICIGS